MPGNLGLGVPENTMPPFERGLSVAIEQIETILRAAGYFPTLTPAERANVATIYETNGQRVDVIGIAKIIADDRDMAIGDPFARVG